MKSCDTCGCALSSANDEGQCVRCLILLALPEVDAASARESVRLEPIAPALPVRTFGDYEIGQGDAGLTGGMGVVYRARQISLNRIVALKLIQAGALATQEQVQRFRNEARAAGSLDHPNIVPIYDMGEVNGLQYFSMQWLPGGSLAEKIWDSNWSLVERVQCMVTIARAIHCAHEKGVLHRDLKPANILLDEVGEPHVTDFGVAKFLQSSEATRAGVIMGSADYMSPEQASGTSQSVGIPSDIFGLGALLYHVLVGQPPFQAGSLLETIRRVQSMRPAELRLLNPEIDPSLQSICLQCLHKKPARRLQSAEVLADQLEAWLQYREANPESSAARRGLRRWRIGVAVAVLILFMTSLVFFQRIRQRGQVPQPSTRSQAGIPPPAVPASVPPAETSDSSILTVKASARPAGEAVLPRRAVEQWQVIPPPAGGEIRDGKGVITLDQPGSFLLTKAADYRDLVFTAELEAAPGTEAHFGVRLQDRAGTWLGMTSWLFDDGAHIRTGMQWSNFELKGEHGTRRAKIEHGRPLIIRMNLKGDTMWIYVNGEMTSGVKYSGPRFLTSNGHAGIRLTKGSLRILGLSVERLE